MNKTISIYDAKTNLSKLIADVKAGKEVVIGGYGKPEVMMVPYKKTNTLKIGVWDKKGLKFGNDIVGPDSEISDLFTSSVSRPFPQ